jgi:hypothetical protein
MKSNFPLVIVVDDYHEFDSYKFNFEINGIKVKYKEVGFGSPSYFDKYYRKYPGLDGYVAVFWIDKEPVKLIKELKKELDDDDSGRYEEK